MASAYSIDELRAFGDRKYGPNFDPATLRRAEYACQGDKVTATFGSDERMWRLASAAIWHTDVLSDEQFERLGELLGEIGTKVARGIFESGIDRDLADEVIAMNSMYGVVQNHRLDAKIAAFGEAMDAIVEKLGTDEYMYSADGAKTVSATP